MRKFIRLFKIRLDESLDISRFKYSNDIGFKIGTILYKLVKLAVFVALFVVIYKLYEDMALAGLASVLPTLSYFVASIVCVLATVMNANETLFGNEDNEFVLSMPISKFAHVIIVFMTLYVKSLVYVLLISGPAAIIYIKYVADMSFLGYWIEGAMLTSTPLCGLACLLGTFIVLTLARHPKKEQIHSGITIFIIVIGCALVFYIANRISDVLNAVAVNSGESAKELLNFFVSNFIYSRIYQYAIVEHLPGYVVLFPIVSLLWYCAFIFEFGFGYPDMIVAFRSPTHNKEYKWVDQIKTPQKRAIFRREFQQLIRSKTYMTKMLLGIIIGTMLAVNTLIFGANMLTAYLSVPQIMLLICFFVGLSNSTYCSLSIEGRRHWITEITPINENEIFRSKVCVNLMFTLPFSFICGAILSLAVRVGIIWGVLYVAVPMLYSLITAYWGIWVDKNFGDFLKESEQQVMHQGLPYVLGYLPGVLFPIIMMFLFC